MEVRMPFEIFRDTDGSPLDAGYIYIGAENQDPIAHPVQAYWDAALTILAAQPIRTIGGYPARSGAPGKLFTASNYSITVKNAKGVLISSVLSAGGTTEIDLASTASNTKGSGMVGHDDTKVYAAGTVGAFLNQFKDITNDLWGAAKIGFAYARAYAANTVGKAIKDLMDRCDSLEARARAVQGATIGYKAYCSGSSAVIYMSWERVTLRGGSSLALENYNQSTSLDLSTTGVGGLDTGTLAANTWYHIFLITDPSVPAIARALASLSSTVPTLPPGYTFFKRMGEFKTDNTANKFPIAMYWEGRKAQYRPVSGSNLTALIAAASGSSVAWGTAVSVSALVPPTAVTIQLVLCTGNVSSAQWAAVAPNASYASAAAAPMYFINGGTSGISINLMGSLVLESTNFYWGCSSAGATVAVLGWETAA